MNQLLQVIEDGKRITFSEALESLGRDFPLLYELEKTPQDAIWHAEGNVAIHTNMVMGEAQKMLQDTGENRLVFVLGALFHDIGKSLCTREYESNGMIRIGSANHAKIGADYLTPIISRLGLVQELTDRILNIVRYHHHPRKIYRSSNDQVLWEFVQIPNYKEVLMFEKMDLAGRRYSGTSEELEIVDLVSTLIDEKLQESNIPLMLEDECASLSGERKTFVYQKTMKFLTDGICSHPWEALSKAMNTPDEYPRVTLLCGAPRSGKTTYRNQHNDCTVICLDDLRVQMTGKKDCFKRDGQVVQEAYKQYKAALANKENIIWDSTNTTALLREKVLSTGESYGAQTGIACFIVDPNEVHKRNKKSEEQVPSSVVDKFFRNWEQPTLKEAHWIEEIYE